MAVVMKRLLLFTLAMAGLLLAACGKPEGDSTPGTTMTGRQGWLELPEMSDTDGYDFFIHDGTLCEKPVRNWSFYWDYGTKVSRWVAYPLYKNIYYGSSESYAWGYDIFLPAAKQQNVTGQYSEGNNGWYERARLIPSKDRAGYDLNASTYCATNIVPMNPEFMSGTMNNLEVKIRSWAGRSDTCYVVSGCICDESKYYVVDRSSNQIPVPTAFFKAILRYSSFTTVGTDGFCAAAFLFDHEEYSNSEKSSLPVTGSMSMSVSELEEVLGYKLFVNLASLLGEDKAEAIKQENPQNNGWWW